VRVREQIVWEEKVMRQKHEIRRELSGFLKTKASPVIVSCTCSQPYLPFFSSS
jgi:hypothetical protein